MSAGMVYFPELSEVVRRLPYVEKYHLMEVFNLTERFNDIIGPYGQYIEHNMMVFINPVVASLPDHDHLFAGEGCHASGQGNGDGNVDGGMPCVGEDADALPDRYNSLMRCYRDTKKSKQLKLSLRQMYWTCE